MGLAPSVLNASFSLSYNHHPPLFTCWLTLTLVNHTPSADVNSEKNYYSGKLIRFAAVGHDDWHREHSATIAPLPCWLQNLYLPCLMNSFSPIADIQLVVPKKKHRFSPRLSSPARQQAKSGNACFWPVESSKFFTVAKSQPHPCTSIPTNVRPDR